MIISHGIDKRSYLNDHCRVTWNGIGSSIFRLDLQFVIIAFFVVQWFQERNRAIVRIEVEELTDGRIILGPFRERVAHFSI